jgi:hypothetical protein
MEPYESALGAISPKTVSFGCQTIHIYEPTKLDSGQVGYLVSPKGESLIRDADGDWRKTWLIIGYDDCGGDPFFIDTSEEGWPVFTAMVGQGRWVPKRIAVSLAAFGHALSVVAAVAQGREYPVALEQNPLTQEEKDATLAAIRQHNPNADLSFWEILLSEA